MEMQQITAETFPAFVDLLSVPFQFDPSEEETANFIQVDELDRTFAATDDGAMVGTFGSYSYELSTPGGKVPAAGLTAVSVLPTHRRRGVLTEMMRRHYQDVRDHGEPVSILWASEWPIYGRFGYGQATEGVAVEVDKQHSALAGPAAPGRCRMIDLAEAEKAFPAVYERVRGRAGMLDRSPRHWKHRHFFDPESWRGGATAHRYTVYEADGEVDGYVKWRGKEEWVDGHAAATATVLELMAATPDAERGLWEFMLGLDLTTKVVAGRRATDDGLFMLLANRRRLRRRIHDALWLAIVDVPAALTARRYAIDGEVVIEVTEGFSDGVAGTYRLSGGPDGAECARVDADPDLTLTATELGALYLGGSRLGPMARWGSAAGSAAAMRLVDLMFAWDEVPWCPEVF